MICPNWHTNIYGAQWHLLFKHTSGELATWPAAAGCIRGEKPLLVKNDVREAIQLPFLTAKCIGVIVPRLPYSLKTPGDLRIYPSLVTWMAGVPGLIANVSFFLFDDTIDTIARHINPSRWVCVVTNLHCPNNKKKTHKKKMSKSGFDMIGIYTHA